MPLLGRRRGCQIRLLVELPVRSEITTGTRVVRGDRDRGDGLSCLAAERTWGRLRPASVDHGRWLRRRRRPVHGWRRRNVEWRYRRKVPRPSRHVGRRRCRRCGGAQRARWWSCSPRPRGCSARDGPQRQRCSLDRAEDSLVGGDPVVGRYALGKQVGIQGGRAQHMLAHRQRHKWLVAVADFDGGRALSRMPHARIVAGAANRKRRILRQFAVQPIRGVYIAGVGRGSPLVLRQEADRANRRIVNREREVTPGLTVGPVLALPPFARRQPPPAAAPAAAQSRGGR